VITLLGLFCWLGVTSDRCAAQVQVPGLPNDELFVLFHFEFSGTFATGAATLNRSGNEGGKERMGSGWL